MNAFLILAPVAYLVAVLCALSLGAMAARSDRRATKAFERWVREHR